jgi:hypothetical protein
MTVSHWNKSITELIYTEFSHVVNEKTTKVPQKLYPNWYGKEQGEGKNSLVKTCPTAVLRSKKQGHFWPCLVFF